MSCWTLVPIASLVNTPWRNNLGTTRDVHTGIGPDGRLRWQVSIANLVQDAPFSFFEHGDRTFIPIEGDPPPELAFHGRAFESCPLLVPKYFSGEWPTLSRISVPGKAFNVIVDRRFLTATVQVLRLKAGQLVEAPAAPHVVLHCLVGQIAAAGYLLGPGDSLLSAGPATSGAMAAEHGTAIIVAVHAAAA